MSVGKAWSDAENVAIVVLYFAMLDYAMSGTPYNKRAMIRAVQGTDDEPGPLHARSKGSVEAKLMNCTAAHGACDPHADTMDCFGYRGLSRYQGALKVAMLDAVNARQAAADITAPSRGFGSDWGIA